MNKKKTQNTSFTKEAIQMANKHMKSSMILVLREMKIKTMITLHSPKWLTLKRSTMLKFSEYME